MVSCLTLRLLALILAVALADGVVSGVARASAASPHATTEPLPNCILANTSEPDGPGPLVYDAADQRVYMADDTSLLWSIDNTTGEATYLTGFGSFGPSLLGVDPLNGHLFGGSYFAGNTTVLSVPGARLLASLPLEMLSSAFDTRTGSLLIVDPAFVSTGPYRQGYWTENVTLVDGATNRIVANRAIGNFSFDWRGGPWPPSAFDTRNGDFYVAFGNNVTVLNGSTLSTVATLTLSVDPAYMAFDGFNGDVYTQGVDSPLMAISGTTDTVVGSVPGSDRVRGLVSTGGLAVDPSNGMVFLLVNSTIVEVNGTSNDVVGTIPLLGSYADEPLAFDTSNGHLYAAAIPGLLVIAPGQSCPPAANGTSLVVWLLVVAALAAVVLVTAVIMVRHHRKRKTIEGVETPEGTMVKQAGSPTSRGDGAT